MLIKQKRRFMRSKYITVKIKLLHTYKNLFTDKNLQEKINDFKNHWLYGEGMFLSVKPFVK